ncbi:TolC family protein [Ramlibacter albus]|uniref:TolC family protein n=1 Tax=Ramlibacter albus TaxID=2079448 RepID=A0A923S5B3_9BURK|nr:TolC family protein [Ramlibacter albus]MBC5768439.1 TolC family protein [Ramlibacter albus]
MFSATSASPGRLPARRTAVQAAVACMLLAWCAGVGAGETDEPEGIVLKLSAALHAARPVSLRKPVSAPEPSSACRAGAAEGSVALHQIVERARQANPDAERARAQVRKARADIETAESAYSPQLRVSASSGSSGSAHNGLASAANAQLSKLLHDFGKTDSLVEEARKREEARVMEHADVLDRITLDVVEAWLGAWRQSELARLHVEAAAGLEEAVRIIHLRAQAGLAATGDVELAQARLAQVRAAGLAACTQREQFLSRLSLLSGTAVTDAVFAMPSALQGNGPAAPWDPSALPGVRQAEAEHRAAVHHVQSLRASRWPSVYLQASRTATGGRGAAESSGGVNLVLNVDVLEGGRESRVESASADAQSALARVASIREAAQDLFRRTRTELEGVELRLPLLRSQALSTASTRRIFLEQFLAGRRQVLDLLNTHQEVLGAEVAAASLEFDRAVLMARLQGLYGGLAESITPAPPEAQTALNWKP